MNAIAKEEMKAFQPNLTQNIAYSLDTNWLQYVMRVVGSKIKLTEDVFINAFSTDLDLLLVLQFLAK